MRYKRGSKVEVLSKSEVSPCSWHSAEIIHGNGHNYTVRYDTYRGSTTYEETFERVSRKSIRPCPPPVELLEDWVPGDVVEVFHNFFWKMAKVSEVLGRNYFLIKLLGFSEDFEVSKVDIRPRQSWQDDKWVLIGKGSENCEDGKPSTRKNNQNLSSQVEQTDTRMNNLHVKFVFSGAKNNINFQDSHIVSSKTLKRGSPYCCSQDEVEARAAKKCRVIEKEGRAHRVLAANQTIDLPQKKLGEEHIYASYNNKTYPCSTIDTEREKLDTDSVTCSVGSCSITYNTSYMLPRLSKHSVEETEGNLSDAESFYRWENDEAQCLLPTTKELEAEIHRLELHAYRCTLEAFHASGPLSWDQEILVTNLRISLHISNDEHLIELRNLLSTASTIPTR